MKTPGSPPRVIKITVGKECCRFSTPSTFPECPVVVTEEEIELLDMKYLPSVPFLGLVSCISIAGNLQAKEFVAKLGTYYDRFGRNMPAPVRKHVLEQITVNYPSNRLSSE